jgi:hypothetical protein
VVTQGCDAGLACKPPPSGSTSVMAVCIPDTKVYPLATLEQGCADGEIVLGCACTTNVQCRAGLQCIADKCGYPMCSIGTVGCMCGGSTNDMCFDGA